MNVRSIALLYVSCLTGVGCFSPTESASSGAEAASSTTSGETGISSTLPSENTNGGADSASSSSGNSTPSSAAEASTEAPVPTGGSSSTGEATGAFCGDGEVDPSEECDAGVDDNDLNGECLPDCNLNVCGDGNLSPSEACDDGEDDNILAVGACAPDCSRVIEEKQLGVSVSNGDGDFFPNPLGVADGLCPAGSNALLALPGQRQATNGTPFLADALIDWPLQPYTAYITASYNNGPDGELVWVTDSSALLGVRDGNPEDLLHAVYAHPQAPAMGVVTGLNNDWTNALTDTCNGWQSDSASPDGRVGGPASLDEFLDDRVYDCSGSGFLATFVYCVEQ